MQIRSSVAFSRSWPSSERPRLNTTIGGIWSPPNENPDMSQILYQSHAVSRRGRKSGPRRPNLQEIDQALWAAYRRYDRSAVMETLLRRFVGRSRAQQPARPRIRQIEPRRRENVV